jgi:hypothetical protein
MYQNKSLAQAAELANAKNETELKAAMINKDAMIKAHQIMAAAQNYATNMNYKVSLSNLAAQQAKMQLENQNKIRDQEIKMGEDFTKASEQLHNQDFRDTIRKNNSNGFWNADVSDTDIAKVGNAVQALLNAKVITPTYASQLLLGMANPGGFKAAMSALSNLRNAPQVDAFGNIVYQTDGKGNRVPVNVNLDNINPLIGKYYDAPFAWGPLVPFFGMSGIRSKQ